MEMIKKLLLCFVIVFSVVCVFTSCVHEHEFGEWTVTNEPTCTADGLEEKTCACGEKETRTIAAKGHISGEWITDKEPNCTEDGSKHQVCSVCDSTIKTEKITKLGHTDGEWITDKEPNCTEDGSKHQVCSVCDSTIKTETLTKFEHNYKSNIPEKACIDEAIVYKCQSCEDTYTKQLQAISADISYCYWSYVDSNCYVQDVLSFNGIQGDTVSIPLQLLILIRYANPMFIHIQVLTTCTRPIIWAEQAGRFITDSIISHLLL